MRAPSRYNRSDAVAKAVQEPISAEVDEEPVQRPLCQCEQYARVTERAALAGARWLGRADQEAAEEAAAAGMRAALDTFPIQGRIVIGAAEEDSLLRVGEEIGSGGAPVDLALDPLEGRGVVARGGNGAMSMIAVGERDSLPTLPDMYMRKMAVGPLARGKIDLLKPMGENVRAIAGAFGRNVNDVTTIVLDRPRHHDLIEEIRAAGARIKLIQDGTVTASISAAIRGTNDHLAVGIGGTRQAVMSAAALRCLGGELQAQLWPTTRGEIERARQAGIEDVTQVFTGEELAPGDVIVVATGVSNGDLLRGVRYLADSARTHSLVMCTRCNWVRFVDGLHFFVRERREEVRLLGY
jgi:fructose-1,6-bisphosphatase II